MSRRFTSTPPARPPLSPVRRRWIHGELLPAGDGRRSGADITRKLGLGVSAFAILYFAGQLLRPYVGPIIAGLLS